jgi:hypothetical protein
MTHDHGYLFPARRPDPPDEELLAAPDGLGVGNNLEHGDKKSLRKRRRFGARLAKKGRLPPFRTTRRIGTMPGAGMAPSVSGGKIPGFSGHVKADEFAVNTLRKTPSVFIEPLAI